MNLRSPFDGGPPTRVNQDNEGGPKITVHITGVGPWRAKLFDWSSFFTAIGVPVYLAYSLAVGGTASISDLAAIAVLPFVLHYGLKFALRQLFPKRVEIEFTPRRFSYRPRLGLVYLPWKHFDRTVPHRFSLIPHHRAEREKLWLEFIERKFRHKWWCWTWRRYFGESKELVFEYQGQRNHIMSIHLQKKAVVIQTRLQVCDEQIEAKGRTGRGVAANPEDEWSRQPGGELA